jgi:hypothetical protein
MDVHVKCVALDRSLKETSAMTDAESRARAAKNYFRQARALTHDDVTTKITEGLYALALAVEDLAVIQKEMRQGLRVIRSQVG